MFSYTTLSLVEALWSLLRLNTMKGLQHIYHETCQKRKRVLREDCRRVAKACFSDVFRMIFILACFISASFSALSLAVEALTSPALE